MPSDAEWLKRMAEKEDGCIVSVGGLVTDLKGMMEMNEYDRLKAQWDGIIAKKVDRLVTAIIEDVCELDYDSPEDQPDLLACTVVELQTILEKHLKAEFANAK